jgi:predicted SAM-dependent methyltransferase
MRRLLRKLPSTSALGALQEHVTQEETVAAARTCFKYLRPGGDCGSRYPMGCTHTRHTLNGLRLVVHRQGQIANGHKVLYTYHTLEGSVRARFSG